jgi:hypothetical protein
MKQNLIVIVKHLIYTPLRNVWRYQKGNHLTHELKKDRKYNSQKKSNKMANNDLHNA